jgi:hypothetical protein
MTALTPPGGVVGGDHLVRRQRTGWRAVAERPPAEGLPGVGSEPAGEVGTGRDDTGRVEVAMDEVVVLLDVVEVDRVAEAGCLEQVPGVGPQHRHLAQLVPVAFEVGVVDGVETNEGREEPDIGFGDGVADQEAGVGPFGQLRQCVLGVGVLEQAGQDPPLGVGPQDGSQRRDCYLQKA